MSFLTNSLEALWHEAHFVQNGNVVVVTQDFKNLSLYTTFLQCSNNFIGK